MGDYGYTSSHPHAVTRTDLGRYGYDSNGNQTSRPGHSLTYTPFNKVRTLVDDGGSEVTRNIYDSDETRAIRRDGQGTTIYVGGLYERQTTPSGTVHHKLYISGPDGVVAEVRRTEGESFAKEFYPIKDRMGSPFTITDGDGNVVQRQLFSAFGGVKSWDPRGEGTAAPAATMNLGYTGHEAADSLGLIDMGGRTYDPLVARFLQADIFVQYPYNLQSFNRYTYGMNNPFRYLDPSGYSNEEVDPPSSDSSSAGEEGSDADSGDATDFGGQDPSKSAAEVNHTVENVTTVVGLGAQVIPVLGDGISFLSSLVNFVVNPSWSSAGDVGLDAVGLLPGLPALGTLRRAGKLADLADGARDAGRVAESLDTASDVKKAAKEVKHNNRFSDEKQALVDMAKRDKRTGMSRADMEAYKELNKQLPDPFSKKVVRGPERHPDRPHGKNWHGHVGPVNHIPIK